MLSRCILVCLLVWMTAGCTAVAVVDAAASTAVGVGKVAAKGVTSAAGALIPDDEKGKKK